MKSPRYSPGVRGVEGGCACRGFNTNDWWISILDVTLGVHLLGPVLYFHCTQRVSKVEYGKPIRKIVTNALFDSISWNE